jgi:glutamate/tyrosine decarboxylase-like PLP-dependent enzyme
LNPQLAAWSHSPLAVETERRLIDAFARKFGFSKESADGCLTSGGAEANLTALLCALAERWQQFSTTDYKASLRDPFFTSLRKATTLF